MSSILDSCLFNSDRSAFEKMQDNVREFNAIYNRNNIVQDDIFNVIKNYCRKLEQQIEILRYPIHDDELYACTFVREGILFVVINSKLALSKQIFAAAHELYHIYCYVRGDNPDFYSTGSILKAKDIDEFAVAAEDKKANAFAGLFLAPKEFIREQIEIYGIKPEYIGLKDILQLMDIFAMPYKAVIIRLLEDGLISEKKADEMLSKSTDEIEKLIQLTGISKRWQISTEQILELGTLEEKLMSNIEFGFLTDDRAKDDQESIQNIKDLLSRK